LRRYASQQHLDDRQTHVLRAVAAAENHQPAAVFIQLLRAQVPGKPVVSRGGSHLPAIEGLIQIGLGAGRKQLQEVSHASPRVRLVEEVESGIVGMADVAFRGDLDDRQRRPLPDLTGCRQGILDRSADGLQPEGLLDERNDAVGVGVLPEFGRREAGDQDGLEVRQN